VDYQIVRRVDALRRERPAKQPRAKVAMSEFRSSSITGRSAAVGILAACLLALALVSYHWLAREAADLSYLLLTALAAAAATRPVRLIGTNAPISAAEPLFFIILLKFGGAAAIPAALLIAVVTSAALPGRRLPRSVGAQFALASFARGVASGAAASVVVHFFPTTGGGPPASSLGESVLLLLCVSLARYLPQVSVTLDGAFLKQVGLRQFVRQFEVQTGLAAYFLTAATAQFVLLMVEHAEMYSALLSLIILTVFYLAYRHYGRKFAATERTAAEARRHAEEVAALHLRTIEALASAIAAKDRTGHKHAQRVLTYAEALGCLFDLPETEAKALRAAALLHDIGKLAIPDYILNKPGQLNAAEMEKIKTHPVIGASILERVGFPYPLVPAVRHHHEHWDGTGYPDKLRGTAIPLTARILAVADAFDSALHHAPFRHPQAKEQAVRLLLSESGRKYDPEVVRRFISHLPTFEEGLAHLQPTASPVYPPPAEGAAALAPLPAYGAELPDTHYLDAIRSAHQEAAEMLGLAQALSSTLNLEETVSIVVARLSRLVRFDACAVYLIDDSGGAATVSGAIGFYAERLHSHRAVPGHGAVGRALADRQVSYSDAPWEEFGNLGRAECPFGSVTAYPLVKDGHVIAVIALLRFQAEPCDAEQLRVLAMITPLASDAIHNALTYRRTEARALTDALTGLPNSRILHSTFEQERNRAERYNNRLAILMIDLDGFKQINDTLGHQAGDDVLRAVAQCLKQELRGGDTLLRYAGDEFVALLHHAEESGLDELLRRIQDSLAARSHFIGGREVRVNASIGYAIYGKDGRELEDLMHAADIAMYRNKTERKQRNRRLAAMPFPPAQPDLPGEMQLPL
jgi:diguanylate cyclase (GGDEF)-like protein/putative nucleotidyltransferase with HDIG domain